jgi:hypothetical protein
VNDEPKNLNNTEFQSTPMQPEFPAFAPEPAIGQPGIIAPAITPKIAKKSKKLLVVFVAVGIVLLTGIAIILFMVFGGKDSSTESTTKTTDTTTTAYSVAPPATDTTTPATAGKTVKTIDKTIRDDEMGFTIKATELVTDAVAIPEKYSVSQEGKVVVIVKVAISSDGTFTGSPSGTSLSLLTHDDKKYVSTSIFDDSLKAASYELLPFAGPESGATTNGYVAFSVDKDKISNLTLSYKRLATKIIGSNETIPAKDFTVALTQ